MATKARTGRQRGQIVVIFSLAIILFMGLCAIAVDISWYWVNSLRIQRAADAAALAGVVHLPSDTATAYSVARAEATKNGYADGVGGYTVTPVQDVANPRRLKVTITGPVGTYFARVFGIASFPARRDAKAEFVLPVPMGSPQSYYGVGFFEGKGAGPTQATAQTLPTATAAPNGWTNANRGLTFDNAYATNATGASQGYGTFGLSIPAGNTVLGVEVRLDAKSSDATGCQVAVALSWNNGTSWTSEKFMNLTGSDPVPPVTIGGAADTWGRTWAPSDFANGSFLVRVRDHDPGSACTNTATSSLDALDVRVSYRDPIGGGNTVFPIPDPGGGSPLVPQNFWGAVFTSGGVRENGDRYAPAYLGNGAGGAKGDPNPNYDPDGYDYTVEFSGGSNGQVQLFDPMFCATGSNGHGGSYGAGDHWTDHPPSQVVAPVHVTYRLYNMNGTPYDESDDTLITTLDYDPGTATMGDFSGVFGTPANSADVNRQDCSTNPAHNQWVVLRTGLAAGKYRVNVNTTLDAANLNVGAENLFSIWVGASGGTSRVYGAGRMAAYTNQDTTVAAFYLAQIEGVHAGKTMTINLFDPGESSGNAYLRILTPANGTSYQYATFNWTSDDGRSGNNVTQIQTSVGGAAQFNNRLLTISIPLPLNYASTDLTPVGETEPGWWKIEYETNQSNDTTTWEVGITGNPVHLVLP
ncbi:MAG TPA: pilus assembly protein TadG-related protein [Candidatus Limnocylindrales bacterium]